MSDLGEIFGVMKDIGVKQMILQGPPGTSKTHGAKEIVLAAINDNQNGSQQILFEALNDYKLTEDQYKTTTLTKNIYWDMVQFHPSYSYEDFVRGITVATQDNAISYDTVNKIFGNICALAAKNTGKTFFLIIDEINRADVATVFGELIYALEYRDHPIATPYKVQTEGRYLTVPENLYIIGTMNTADKSVGTIDMAIRRRFLFVDQLPDVNVIDCYFDKATTADYQDLKAKTIACFNFLKAFVENTIRGNYKAKDFEIGHTYFLPSLGAEQDPEKEIGYKLQYQVLPMLREYVDDKILAIKSDDADYDTIMNACGICRETYTSAGYKSLCAYLNGNDDKLGDAVKFLLPE